MKRSNFSSSSSRCCCWLLFLFILQSCCHSGYSKTSIFGVRKSVSLVSLSKQLELQQQEQQQHDTILETLRGGASSSSSSRKKKKKKRKSSNSRRGSIQGTRTVTGNKRVKGKNKDSDSDSALSEWMTKYRGILPVTRIHITMIVIATVMGVVLGDELMQQWMSLDPARVLYGFELWRPLTAASFLGPPSIGSLMSCYYLFTYGSTLEAAYGTAQHVLFLSVQLLLLSMMGSVFGQPFSGQALITAMLHVLSRSMPFQKVKWLVFTIPYWALPLGFMVSDVLQAQSAAAAVPHVLGMLAGHFYHFHKFIWPNLDRGEDWLNAPDFVVSTLENTSNKKKKKTMTRKKGKGRKLGN